MQSAGERVPEAASVERRVLRSLRRVFCRGELALAEDLFASDYLDHDPDGPSAERGPESVRRLIHTCRAAFPDLHLRVEEQVVEGDTVLTRWKGRGTHLGPWLDRPPSGKRVSLRGVTVTRFAGAQAVEGWSNWELPSGGARRRRVRIHSPHRAPAE